MVVREIEGEARQTGPIQAVKGGRAELGHGAVAAEAGQILPRDQELRGRRGQLESKPPPDRAGPAQACSPKALSLEEALPSTQARVAVRQNEQALPARMKVAL